MNYMNLKVVMKSVVCWSVFVNSSSQREREKTWSSRNYEGNMGFL
jgi:hypothetical protein